MTMSKRAFLMAAAAAGPIAVTLMRSPSARAADGDAAPKTQFVGVQHFKVGDRVATAVLDGHLNIDPKFFATLTADDVAALLKAAHLPNGPVTTGVNVYVLRDGESTIVIDGGGAGFTPTMGALPRALEAAGVAPEEVDLVLATHLHPDHIGGLLDKNGAAFFPNAGLRAHQADIDFWTNDEIRAGAPDPFKGFFDLAKKTLSVYGDRVAPFSKDEDVAKGVAAIHLPGHTPGHSGFRIEGGGAESLLVWGDIVHVAAFQFPKPTATIGFDVDKDLAAKTRAKLFDEVVKEDFRIAGMHLAFPGVGRVEKAGDGYRFAAEPWSFTL